MAFQAMFDPFALRKVGKVFKRVKETDGFRGLVLLIVLPGDDRVEHADGRDATSAAAAAPRVPWSSKVHDL